MISRDYQKSRVNKRRYRTYTTDHAWSCAAYLEMVLSNSGSIEHSVESSYLIHLHRSHLQHFGDFVHRSEGKEVIVLLLSDEKCWNHSAAFIIVGVLL